MEKPSALRRGVSTFRRKGHIGVNDAFNPYIKRSESRAMFVSWVAKGAKIHAPSDCVALRISPNWDLE